MSNQRGSALIESVLAMLNIGCVVAVVGTALYISFAKVWIHFSLYEGIYCFVEEKPRFICENKTRKRIDRIIPLPSLTTLSISKSQNSFTGRIRLGGISDESWKNKLTRRIFEYELRIDNPANQYRHVR